MPSVAAVHLVWAPLGLEPVKRFAASWRAHGDSELIALCNGFASREDAVPALAELGDPPAVFTDHPVQDLAAYLHAARSLEHGVLVFFNSHSEVLVDGVVATLVGHLGEGVGAVGATGTYETARRGALRSGPWPNRLVAYAKEFPHHPGFPNPHLRTNAFAVPRELFVTLDPGPLETKDDAHRFESGRRSITRQLQWRGQRVLVAGRDGVAYEPADWQRSATFRSGGQRNLLVADNRTRDYEGADPPERAALERLSWGR